MFAIFSLLSYVMSLVLWLNFFFSFLTCVLLCVARVFFFFFFLKVDLILGYFNNDVLKVKDVM